MIKIFYSVPIFIYVYVVTNLPNLLVYNYIGLILTSIGTFLVVKAKVDIGKYHTWTGHILDSTKMITRGIYAFIRYPLYTGIYVFILGAVLNSINNNPFSFYLTLIIVMFLLLIMTFLAITALKESRFLQIEFGEKFLEYKKQVHSFLLLRKYNFEE